jgi:chemotaxis family two-component system response regulator Rcp1
MREESKIRPVQILLVEDSPDDVELTTEALNEGKLLHNLHVAADGMEAMDFLHRRGKYTSAPEPDLVLLDLNLPRKDGREVLDEIKSEPGLAHLPVIVLTTSTQEEDILKSYQLHANSYMTKPVDLEQFVRAVKALENYWLTVVKLPHSPTRGTLTSEAQSS